MMLIIERRSPSISSQTVIKVPYHPFPCQHQRPGSTGLQTGVKVSVDERICGISRPDPVEVRNRMSGGEVNIQSIRVLEDQIREHERIVIRLKRSRNSLLNISKLPPELLGRIFRWNITPKGNFDGLEEGSHNFLLVCYHWFEVASGTPGLWSFWGNTLKDWARWYRHSRTAPLDLVLDADDGSLKLGTALCDVLRDHASRGAIRRVDLRAAGPELLRSVISPLTPTSEGTRPINMTSFSLWTWGNTPVDVSDFFTRYHLPKLRRLHLQNCTVSSWDCLTSQTAVLTTLILDLANPSPTPSTSQLLSVLASNPALRKVVLFGRVVPNDDGDRSSFRVKLQHLEKLRLEGDLRRVIGLLHRLDHPRNMDLLRLTLHDCDVTDVSQIIGPYIRDHLQRRDRSPNGLNLSVSFGHYTKIPRDRVVLRIGDAGGIDFSTPTRTRIDTFAWIIVVLNVMDRRDILTRAAQDLIAHTPREEVSYFQTYNNPVAMEEMYIQFPHLRALSSSLIPLPKAFPNPGPVGNGKVFPSLEHIRLEQVVVDGGDWSPLINFLAARASSGNRLDTLVITNSAGMHSEVMEGIRGLVRELKIDRPYGSLLPFDVFAEP